jgi:opacity protein-like surface antigen
MMKGISFFLVCCLALNGVLFASVPHKLHRYKDQPRYKDAKFVAQKKPGHFELIGAGGIAKLNAGNPTLGITSSETDTLHQTNSSSWNTLAGQLGLGYVYYFRNLDLNNGSVQWFKNIEPQLNVYQLSTNSIKGNVWRFNNPSFSQLTFDIPIHSTRLMLDAALNIVSWKKISLYGIGGIGNAWTRVGFSERANDSVNCADQQVSLKDKTTSSFAWEAGAGMRFDFNDRVGLSFEYLYTDLGHVQTSATGSSGTITAPVLGAAKFGLKAQTAFLGLHIAL